MSGDKPTGTAGYSFTKKVRGLSVYFIVDEAANAVKIGISKSPESRLGDMQLGSAGTLRLVKVIENQGFCLERKLHKQFANSKIHGEWFKLSEDLMDYLQLPTTNLDDRLVVQPSLTFVQPNRYLAAHLRVCPDYNVDKPGNHFEACPYVNPMLS